ncbi:retrovirus-related pol polyprotein from transposon TNT 1-94 [Tanacetum coccineum]
MFLGFADAGSVSTAISIDVKSTYQSNAPTRYKGKEIAKPITPPSASASEEDNDPEQAQRDKDMQKNLALIANYTGQFGNQRTTTVAGVRETIGSQDKRLQHHKEKMLLCKQAEKGVPLQAEQADWLEDTDEEIDEQELEAHYGFMAKIQEVLPPESNSNAELLEKVQYDENYNVFANERPHSEQSESINDTYVEEKVDSNVIPDSPDKCDNVNQANQNAEECDDERVVLANLIANFKLDTDETKKIHKQLKKANATLAQQLQECKYTLQETISSRDKCLIALQVNEIKLEKYKTNLNRQIENEKLELERKLKETLGLLAQKEHEIKEVDLAWEKHTHGHFRASTAKDMEVLIKTCLMPLTIKTQKDSLTFVNALKQEMFKDLTYVQSLEKDNDELENDKAEFSNMYDLLPEKCVSKDVMCSYLHSLYALSANAQTELQCMYHYKVKECECLAQKFSKQTGHVSKEVYNELSRSFAKLEKHSISLKLALQQCKEQLKNNTVCKETTSNVFRKEREQYHEIQDLKAQLQDKNIAISELKKLIEKFKGKYVETKTDKPSVFRQPNAQRIPKPSVMGKPTPFLDSLKKRDFSKPRSVTKTNVSEGVTHKTSVSRPLLKNTQIKDTVVQDNSQVKFKNTEVEDHHTITSISNKTKSVTACNDSLKSRTSNANDVCATCGNYVFYSNHDACVSKYLNDVNARTKKHKEVPISTRKPKSQANKSVATPPTKIVASESTTHKSRSYFKTLYENSSKKWTWWIEKQSPLGYNWKPKPKMIWVPKIRNENVKKRVSFAIDNASRITNLLKLTNTLGSNFASVPSSSNSLVDCSTNPLHCTVRFGNDQFAQILSYGNLVQGNTTIKRGNNLLSGTRGSDLYTIILQDLSLPTPICLLAKASPTQAWLWHRRLSHLNFDTINMLSKNDIVIGLPKLKFVKD